MIEAKDKHLTIKEAKNEKEKLQNELDLYLTKKQINFNRTQPKATNYDNPRVSGGTIQDVMAMFGIRDEEVDDKIYSIVMSMASYDYYIAQEMKRISKIEPQKMEIYNLREDEDFYKKFGRKRTWAEVVELSGFSDKQVRRICQEIENGRF